MALSSAIFRYACHLCCLVPYSQRQLYYIALRPQETQTRTCFHSHIPLLSSYFFSLYRSSVTSPINLINFRLFFFSKSPHVDFFVFFIDTLASGIHRLHINLTFRDVLSVHCHVVHDRLERPIRKFAQQVGRILSSDKRNSNRQSMKFIRKTQL